MTIKELVECATFVQNVEIVIRTTGLSSTWIQGYRIGPKAKIYPYEYRVEERERRPHKTETLKPGEEADVIHSQELPLKVIAVDPKRMPEASVITVTVGALRSGNTSTSIVVAV